MRAPPPSALGLTVLAALAACDSPRTLPANPTEHPPMPTQAVETCRATVAADADGVHHIELELRNPTDRSVHLAAFQPFLQFRLRAEAGGEPVPVIEPPLDLGIQAVTLEIPAQGTLTLRPPIQLVIAADAVASDDPFTWTIAHDPRGLDLVFTLELPPPYDQPCRTTPAGAPAR